MVSAPNAEVQRTNTPSTDADEPLYVVAIGSSAGALGSLELFFANMPEGVPVCYVLVMHMAADHDSMIGELLTYYTSMPIVEAVSGQRLQRETIYYVSGNLELSVLQGSLKVSEKRSSSPIDFFMASLAQDQASRAIGIVLSGAACDGTLGVKRIKEGGGLTIAQNPDTAEHSGMPRSAISTNAVDLILNAQEMPRNVLKWIKNEGKIFPEDPDKSRKEAAVDLQRVFYLLKSTTGHDFTLYKKNTIKRRLERRMIVQNIELLSDYVRHLESDVGERVRLLKELLIGVTNFFRDPEAFEVLKNEALAHITRDLQESQSLRIWVAGCSTGEEAYSIAMVIMESCQHLDFDLKIFASDIDKDAIEFAREGRYPLSIANEVSQERIERFFVHRVHEYQIKKEIKDKIIFSHHDVTRDPPFSKLNLISCRNLMIYMEPILQQKLLRVFHYSLIPTGLLFMGNSETIGDASGMFSTFDKKWKLFERKSAFVTSNRSLDFEAFRDFSVSQPEKHREITVIPRKQAIRELSHEVLLEQFAPPSVVCDELGEILYIHGRTSNFIEPPMGEARLNIFGMARDGIKLELRRGFQKILAEGGTVRFADLPVKINGQVLSVDVTLRILTHAQQMARIVLVTFEEGVCEPITAENSIQIDRLGNDERVREIERELIFTREHMQTLVEHLETSNEELKSMNEELQSSNEELQSSNEELETAKEELQAVNEELITVNSELHEKIEELSTANNDLDNFLSSSSIATIFLDRNFHITRYSRSTTKIFNLIPSDVGRSLGDIANQVKQDSVLECAEEVLNNLAPLEKMVELKDGRWLFMRITPYKTADNVIDGVVIGFSDVSEQRRLEHQAQVLKGILEKGKVPALVFDADGNIVFISSGLCEELGYKDGELIPGGLDKIGYKPLSPMPDASLRWEAWTGQVAFRTRTGSIRVFQAKIDFISENSDLKCLIVAPKI